MELITAHVDKDNFVMINCPFCGAMKRASVNKFKGIRHKITISCKCNNRFKIQLNFRRFYRKNVPLQGEVINVTSNMPNWKHITVLDLSRTGLRFKLDETATISIGDTLRVRFSLDTKKPLLVDEIVTVKGADDEFFGCEFKDLDRQEKQLGFYLLS